jgi:TATA-box binding protein (TBP) (component of TFIID and TFIIIB)
MQVEVVPDTADVVVFGSGRPTKPPLRFLLFPPNCIDVSNVVTQTRFNMKVRGNVIMQKYPFCRRNSKNWRAILLKTEDPDGAASIYDIGMMMITGCTSVRTSRYAADRYVDLLRSAGYPDLKIVDFQVINLTTTFAFEAAFDADKYRDEVYPMLHYLPDGFVGARKRTQRTGALLTMFTRNGTALGTRDMPNLCRDVFDELELMRSCMVPFGSEEEKELEARISQRRKRASAVADQTMESATNDDAPIVDAGRGADGLVPDPDPGLGLDMQLDTDDS